jgi:hypothetical protein
MIEVYRVSVDDLSPYTFEDVDLIELAEILDCSLEDIKKSEIGNGYDFDIELGEFELEFDDENYEYKEDDFYSPRELLDMLDKPDDKLIQWLYKHIKSGGFNVYCEKM